MSKTSNTLDCQNLIPFYLVQDRLKSNFEKINQFISQNNLTHDQLKLKIKQREQKQNQFQNKVNQTMRQMQIRIQKSISGQLQGKIALMLSSRMAGIIQNAQKRQESLNSLQANIDKKLQAIKKSLKFQISQQNQIYFNKQIKKFKAEIGTNTNGQKSHRVKIKKDQSLNQQGDWLQSHRASNEIQSRIVRLEQYTVKFDKRFYQNMTSLKQNWKQLGTQLLQNKSTVNKRIDQLRTQIIRLKNSGDFVMIPQKAQQSFKTKLSQKFIQIYKMLALTVNKHQYEDKINQMNKVITRHNQQFEDIRGQLSTNSDYFTFYMNNANNDNIYQMVEELGKKIDIKNQQTNKQLTKVKNQIDINHKSCQQLVKSLEQSKQLEITFDQRITHINQKLKQQIIRIEKVQDLSSFGPQKLGKIHNALDIDLTIPEQQLVERKPNVNPLQALSRQLKGQIGKIKDDLFVVTTLAKQKQLELVQAKKMIENLQSKVQKIKFQAEEAVISRKPWVCLSCDRQQKDAKKETKFKKTEQIRAGGFLGQQKSSQKNIKPIPAPTFEQKFEVYEKFRQKYLTDTIKLPEIYKQKLGEKQLI